MQRHIEDPVLFIAAPSDEVDTLTSLKDLVRKAISEKRGYHDVVKPILLSPKLLITNSRVRFDKELRVWVVDLTCKHPGLNHGQNWRGNLFQNSTNELLGGRTSIQNISVDRRTNCSTLEILNQICDYCQPLHPLQWLLYPEIKLAQIEVVRSIITSVACSLALQYGKQTIILSQFSLHCKA